MNAQFYLLDMIECKFCDIIKLGKRDDKPHKKEPHGKLEKFLWVFFLLRTKNKKISVKKRKNIMTIRQTPPKTPTLNHWRQQIVLSLR